MSETETAVEAEPIPPLVQKALAGEWHPAARLKKLHFVDVAVVLGVPINVAHAAILAYNASEKRRESAHLQAMALHSKSQGDAFVWREQASELLVQASKLIESCMDVLGRKA